MSQGPTIYFTDTMDSPCGPLFLMVDGDGRVVRIEFDAGREDKKKRHRLEAAGARLEPAPERLGAVKDQLEEYFAGERTDFALALAPQGSPFQLEVWEALRTIPFGETRSYGEIARAIGRPNASRAVGAANGANPIPIVVPCHRVIGADGSLTGFGGGLRAKTVLLELEGLAVSGEQVEDRQMALGFESR
jgi:methylated-DNA-[protein]-cysteine S-methyltransferase